MARPLRKLNGRPVPDLGKVDRKKWLNGAPIGGLTDFGIFNIPGFVTAAALLFTHPLDAAAVSLGALQTTSSPLVLRNLSAAPSMGALGIAGELTATTNLLLDVDFTTQSAGGGSIPSPLSFSRASAGHSVQTGTSTVALGGSIDSNDVPRYGRRLDAHNIGLIFEETSTNNALQSRTLSHANWAPFGSATVTSGQTDPAGGTGAYRIQLSSGNNAVAETATSGSSGPVVGSSYVRAVSGTETPNHNIFKSAGRVASSASVGTSFQRIAVKGNATAQASSYVLVDGRDWSGVGGVVAGNRDAVVDLVQREFLNYATEAIITTTATVTRAGERLFLATGSNFLAADDSLRLYVKLRPKGSSSDYLNDMRFWHVDANNHAEVVASTGAVKITIGGTAYTTATAATWAANDLVEFWIAAGGGTNATVVKYRVNGGSVTTLSTGSPPTQAAITISGALDLLCASTSNQFTSRVEQITIYPVALSPSGF